MVFLRKILNSYLLKMLASLSVKNYALIESLNVDFKNGFSIITGETGAGKSILLGALGLALGNRADHRSLKNKEEKCVIEVQFDIEKYNLSAFFEQEDIDIEHKTIIRREILPSGKSRAFVNDTPTSLNTLKKLSSYLIDLHSQHQNLQVSDREFQMYFIDAIARNQDNLQKYCKNLKQLEKLKTKHKELLTSKSELDSKSEYHQFLLEELVKANLKADELEVLERRLDKLNQIEEIKQKLFFSHQLIEDDTIGITSNLNKLKNTFEKLYCISGEYSNLYNRISTCYIEIDDIQKEVHHLLEHTEYEPKEIEQLNDRLQLIYDLKRKHSVKNTQQLLGIQEKLNEQVHHNEHIKDSIKALEIQINDLTQTLNNISKKLSNNRKKIIPQIEDKIHAYLNDLGMPDSIIKIELTDTDEFSSTGKNKINFLLSASKQSTKNEIAKVASGGELSRIMFAIKVILSSYSQLPTIIFDEIDTGISGEIADKMAKMMRILAQTIQIITITHLPQLASKGTVHYKVFKQVGKQPKTKMIQLSIEDRILEIAQMISGESISNAAKEQAKQLLQ